MSVATLRYEEPPAAAPAASGRLQRGRGVAEVGFVRRGDETVLAHLYQQTPCRILFPRVEAGDPPLAVLLTTSGGLAGGDEIRLAIAARAGARAGISTQAAEKVYRSLGPRSEVEIELTVETGAWLEWLPQETILFDGARIRRRLNAEVAPGGRLLAAETLVFGRVARGEELRHGLVQDIWRIRRNGRLVWADGLRLEDDIAAVLDRPFAFAGARALATALYVGDDAAVHLPLARDVAESGTSRGSASFVGGLVLARFFGSDAAAVRADLGHWLMAMRHAAAGLPERLPRVWDV